MGTHNAARRLLEGLSSTASAVSSASAGPARMLAEWTADRIAPDYWVPNAEIKGCIRMPACLYVTHIYHVVVHVFVLV